MFFVSEEFLRKYEAGEEVEQTIDEAVPVGEELFDETGGKGKREYNARRRRKSEGRTEDGPVEPK